MEIAELGQREQCGAGSAQGTTEEVAHHDTHGTQMCCQDLRQAQRCLALSMNLRSCSGKYLHMLRKCVLLWRPACLQREHDCSWGLILIGILTEAPNEGLRGNELLYVWLVAAACMILASSAVWVSLRRDSRAWEISGLIDANVLVRNSVL